MKPEEFDKQFLPWLEAQTKTTVDGFDELEQAVVRTLNDERQGERLGRGDQGRHRDPRHVFRITSRRAASTSFSREAYLAKNDKAKAMEQLERYAEVGGRDPETLEAAGRRCRPSRATSAAAVTTLERLT